MMGGRQADLVRTIIRSDPLRWSILQCVERLQLPDCWVAAGFVRNAVWDHLHCRVPGDLVGDVDVVWFDPAHSAPPHDRTLEATLRVWMPSVQWSVKNQARMHARNGDAPYSSTLDAMRAWPETATAVAVRRQGPETCDVLAPFGLHDLFSLILRPTPRFATHKRSLFDKRLRTRHWQAIWPLLRVEPA